MIRVAPESIDIATLPSLLLSERKRLPNLMACYLVMEGENIIYVGKSSTLALRWNNHNKLKHLQSRNSATRITWIECSDSQAMFLLENAY